MDCRLVIAFDPSHLEGQKLKRLWNIFVYDIWSCVKGREGHNGMVDCLISD